MEELLNQKTILLRNRLEALIVQNLKCIYRKNNLITHVEITDDFQFNLYQDETYTETTDKPVYRQEPVYATKYYYEIDKWTVVDTSKSSGNDQNPSWPEPKLKDGQRTGAEEEHYFVTATYEKKKGKTETGRYEMDFSQWKELKKGEKIELKIDAAGFAEINQK